MSSHHQRLPEPALPESELIRAADTLPELSSGLRSATLAVCEAHVRRARRVRRVKAASVVLVAASVFIAIGSLFVPTGDNSGSPMVEDATTPQVSPAWTSPADASSGTEAGAVISFGAPRQPAPSSDPDDTDRSIERIHKRTQDLMKAGLVPGL